MHSSAPDRSLINWRFKTVQNLLAFIGAYPDVAYRKGQVRLVSLGGGSGSIDLIPAGNSSKNSDSSDKWAKKLEQAKKRLSRLPECGKSGHLMLVVKSPKGGGDGGSIIKASRFEDGGSAGSLELRYHPHRCHSIFCPYCSYENFKESYARILPILESLRVNGRLSFITLTHKNTKVSKFEDVEACIDGAFRALTKFYQFRLFGKRNWERVRRAFARECLSYYRNAKEKFGIKEARLRVHRQIEFFREFERRYGSYIGSDVKLGQLLNAVVKFELTFNAEKRELHPHWHLIVADFYIPKLLLTVIWREVSGSDVVDVRAVSGDVRDATAELVKYVTKGWEFPEGDIRLWVEAVMLGRRKFRVWGFELIELEEEKQEEVEYIGFWSIRCELKYRKNLHEVGRLVRRMRRAGIKKARIDRLIIYDELQGVFEVDLWLLNDGSLVVLDESVITLFECYAEHLKVFGSLSFL